MKDCNGRGLKETSGVSKTEKHSSIFLVERAQLHTHTRYRYRVYTNIDTGCTQIQIQGVHKYRYTVYTNTDTGLYKHRYRVIQIQIQGVHK